jgi:NitT/TauT family transport system ATP-binding protein
LRQQLNLEPHRLWREQRWTGIFVTHNVAEAVFLSQRVLVMSQRPGTIVAAVEIPEPAPRSSSWRTSASFTALLAQVTQNLSR